MKKIIAPVLLALFFAAISLPALAASFSGMALRVTSYSITVKNNDDIRIFQIRPGTAGDHPHNGDQVKVGYFTENGILVATHIQVKRRFMP